MDHTDPFRTYPVHMINDQSVDGPVHECQRIKANEELMLAVKNEDNVAIHTIHAHHRIFIPTCVKL